METNTGSKITTSVLIACGFELIGSVRTIDKKLGNIYIAPSFPPIVKEKTEYCLYEVDGVFRHYFKRGQFYAFTLVSELVNHHSSYTKKELFKNDKK